MATFYAQQANCLQKGTFYSEQRKLPLTVASTHQGMTNRTKDEAHVISRSTLFSKDFNDGSTSRRDGRQKAVLLVAKPYSQAELMNQIIKEQQSQEAPNSGVVVLKSTVVEERNSISFFQSRK